ncbi:efflux RND transporter periplasmic adaptor subunit [Ralstonia nicotianae]|uniref:efflux RND transporter periplasmic adaptor subunit n=1 Tax=Ralstonia pseudosolanacearum TaxID=1310165 RepID=UPI0002C0BA15|nr:MULTISPECIES: efflux RND transporter periplasmic adaptor subunit [Ralstonia]ANH35797.1 Cobalt-zinc-cadmium resistance protein CzcA [Ralstonia solanacearum]APF89240.1 efflux transporter periplasmic adaptor subunit [Ralstonia solanacearum FJAT-1458]ARS59330.1 efflux transporter periplasmic adaptor subunit [Ralstonia solanacearum FJAT-91]ESS49928.1 putative lipoprotein [Ralstonia solanacearum SD54]AGH87059.1 Cobalt-zinc-cadmium resistance protein CzcA; Cation efflux system protein CusA [Ralsto
MIGLRVWMAGLVPVMACVLAACGRHPADAQAANAKPALTVDVVRLSQRVWPRAVTASGAVQAWQEASIGAEVSGLKLADVLVNVGDVVRQGQLLARLSDETVRTDLAAQRAALAEAEAAAAQAAGEAHRAHELDKSGAISQQELIQYDTQAKTAAAKLASARAQFDSQQIRLRYTRVLAPDDGVISARSATVGAVVSAGTELFKLIRKNRLEWRAEVHGDLLPGIRPGQAARLRRMDGGTVAGRVRQIAPTVDASTRNGLVYIDLPAEAGGPGGVKAGMYLFGEILLGDAPAATLPETAVFSRDGYDYAMVLGAHDHVRQVKVAVGRRQDGQVEVTQGIGPADAVVAIGAAFLNDGDAVRLAGPGEAASAPAGAAR